MAPLLPLRRLALVACALRQAAALCDAAPGRGACEAGAAAEAAESSLLQVPTARHRDAPERAIPATSPRRKKDFVNRSKPFFYKGGGEVAAADAGSAGAIIIDEDGVMNKYYLPGATTLDGDTTVEYTPPYRFYLMKTPTTDYGNAENFYKPKFVGKTFSVDIELSGVACGCNLNFYLVDMPASSPGQDQDYYCDAQCYPGLGCCAEFDMNEGNANVQQVTNHACTADYADHSDWECQEWGDPEDKTTMEQFSNGQGSTIDGSKKFTYSQSFELQSGELVVTTTITQGGSRVTMTMGPSEQLQAMYTQGSLEQGMVFVTGYWDSSSMNWLDGDECGEGSESCTDAPAKISNWRITTNA